MDYQIITNELEDGTQYIGRVEDLSDYFKVCTKNDLWYIPSEKKKPIMEDVGFRAQLNIVNDLDKLLLAGTNPDDIARVFFNEDEGYYEIHRLMSKYEWYEETGKENA